MPRKALITAAASEIGAATARKAAADGYDVVISDIDVAAGERLAAEYGMSFIECDLADEGSIVSLVERVGPVHLLVNNGGIAGPTAPLTEVSTQDWRRVMEINLTAQFIACREMVPLMTAAGGGAIANLSSVAGKIGYPNRTPYAASKWAVLGLTAALAREVGAHGIRVNAILPGTVRGERIGAVLAGYADANGVSVAEAETIYLGHHATGRFVEADEIAATILFLASDEGRSITGQFVSVDGGYQ